MGLLKRIGDKVSKAAETVVLGKQDKTVDEAEEFLRDQDKNRKKEDD